MKNRLFNSMTSIRLLLSLVFLSMIASCSHRDAVEVKVDEDPLKSSVETELAGTQNSDLFVFVGEKIEVVEFRPEGEMLMDQAFKAKYKVTEKVFGEFNGNTIEFEVYDHYGIPPFARFKNVLLFVSKHEGKLYHEKYQYFDVYQTQEGKWASCGDPYRFDEYHRRDFTSVPLNFVQPIIFSLEKLSSKQIKEFYPDPFFEIEGKRAICRMGAYVEDLFFIKKNGVLNARGMFKSVTPDLK